MASEPKAAEPSSELERLRERVAELESIVGNRGNIERALHDQLRFLQTLIDTIPNPIFYKNRHGNYLGCNKAFERRTGWGRNEIVGKSAAVIFSKNLASQYEQHDAELLENPGEKIYETKVTYPDGTEHDVIITKGIFTDAEGNVAGLVGVTSDITERKRAEDALQRAHDELEKRVEIRTAALGEANRNLENEIAERGRIAEELRVSSEKLKIFAYSVAHDLKSPSVGIYGLTRLLKKSLGNVVDERGAYICDQIMKASEHVASLVDEINMFIHTKEAPLKIEPVNTEEIFRMLQDEFSARLRVRQVNLIGPSTLPTINADRLSIVRIFRNLIDNALKYGGDVLTRVKIDYEISENFHNFTVSDDGVGIGTDKTGKIFGWLQRQNGSAGIEGTGLGLAIVKEIIERHKGEIRVGPGSPGGTVFHVRIARDL